MMIIGSLPRFLFVAAGSLTFFVGASKIVTQQITVGGSENES